MHGQRATRSQNMPFKLRLLILHEPQIAKETMQCKCFPCLIYRQVCCLCISYLHFVLYSTVFFKAVLLIYNHCHEQNSFVFKPKLLNLLEVSPKFCEKSCVCSCHSLQYGYSARGVSPIWNTLEY